MHNINFIRENPIEFDNAMKQRGEKSLSKKINSIKITFLKKSMMKKINRPKKSPIKKSLSEKNFKKNTF